ncbi:MAG: putative quinol monooxygenase [Bryobacteraceae bacterium]
MATDPEIVVVAHFTAYPGKEGELSQLLQSLVEPTRAEPGCIRCELNQELEDPRCFTFAEKFRDGKALEAHRGTPHLKRLRESAGLVESRAVRIHHELLPVDGGASAPELKDDQVVVIAHFTAKDCKIQELSDFLRSLVAPTRQEPGCLRYEVNQDLDDPATFTFVETFAGRAGFDAHCATPYVAKLFEMLPILVEKQYIGLHRRLR